VSNTPLQVLLVEDNAGDARLLREMFSKERHGSFELAHHLRVSDALIHLAKSVVDVVLLDVGLPEGHGIETVRRTRAVAPEVPVIVLTGLDDEALAAEAMREGAQDYLIKGQIESRALPRALRHAIERHRAQAETDQILTHQLQFKDEFLSHVSHELRSPLNAIYHFVTILLDNLAGELKSEQRQYLETTLRNVKQLRVMIDDLLEVTRAQAGKLTIELQCTSVAEAIAYTINTLQGAANSKGIRLLSEIESALPSVCADPTRVRQVLIILVDNAIKFTPANGIVKIHARVLEDRPDNLLIQVSDTGCGINPGMTERICRGPCKLEVAGALRGPRLPRVRAPSRSLMYCQPDGKSNTFAALGRLPERHCFPGDCHRAAIDFPRLHCRRDTICSPRPRGRLCRAGGCGREQAPTRGVRPRELDELRSHLR
jgi:signal transduction histidine kinase